jgi:hypothetical protein
MATVIAPIAVSDFRPTLTRSDTSLPTKQIPKIWHIYMSDPVAARAQRAAAIQSRHDKKAKAAEARKQKQKKTATATASPPVA